MLIDFHSGSLDAATAASHLGVSPSRLYELSTDLLSEGVGDRPKGWPPEAHRFSLEFLPLQNPPNYQLVADEFKRLCIGGWARSSGEAHDAHRVPTPQRKPRVDRRSGRARIGELFGNTTVSSTIGGRLTLDDHSRLNLADRFVESDTIWNHFEHFRQAFETWDLPEIIYTDGLSLFGPSSSHDHRDPKSEFHRALRGFGVVHLVAPTPQAKGKIERRFGTVQRHLVTLLAHARAETWRQSGDVLQMGIFCPNRTINRVNSQPADQFGRGVKVFL